MEIKVNNNALVLAELSLEKFEKDLKVDLNLEDAFKNNVVLKKNELDDPPEMAINFMFLAINWGQILKLYKDKRNVEDTLRLGVYKCKIEGFTVYYPGIADNNKFHFDEEKKDLSEYIVVHSFIPLIEHHFENLLSDLVFDYSKKDIKWIHHMR